MSHETEKAFFIIVGWIVSVHPESQNVTSFENKVFANVIS